MFKELYTMIDELHTITNSPQFTSMRYRHAMNKISDAYEAMSEKIERALLPAIMNLNRNFLPPQELLDAGEAEGSKRFAELYIKTMEKQLARKPNP